MATDQPPPPTIDAAERVRVRASVADTIIQGEVARLQALSGLMLVLCIAGSIAGAIGAAHVLLNCGLGPERSSSTSDAEFDDDAGSGAGFKRLSGTVLYPWVSIY